MIVWLASYPRSGATFLRIVVHRLYGLPTYSLHDGDPVAQRIGTALVGSRPRPHDRRALRASREVFFTATHERRADDTCPAIYLVRDGRDAVVSQARLYASQYRASARERRAVFEAALLDEILTPDHERTSGSWGANVLSWLRPARAPFAVLRYEELIREPRACVTRAVASLAPQLETLPDAQIPAFAELHRIDPEFFRRGIARSHRDELPAALHDLYWSQRANAEAMRRLRYDA